MFRKFFRDLYKDEVYPANSRYSYNAIVGDNHVTIATMKETYRDLTGVNSFSEISEGDKIYIVKHGTKKRVKRTVRQVSVVDDTNLILIEIELISLPTTGVTGVNNYNISSVNGQNIQIGEGSHMLVNISITELVEKVAKSGDPQAKSMLKQLLENSTVASIVGAGASALLGLL